MPKKTKENEELKEKKNTTKSTSNKTKKVTNKKETDKTPATSKKITSASKTTSTKTSTKKSTKTSKLKNTTTSKKNTSKSEKTTTKKTSKAKKTLSSKKQSKKVEDTIVEYYDLPQRYNQTVVKVLAQTPKTLFIYWEISDDDIIKYKNQYGENFFETTKPVLIIHNYTLNYSFEVEINDFANSWYLHINDSKSDYRIELGRRPIYNNENIKENYIYISSSNQIESPNDHILFNNSQKMVYYRNVKTNQEIQKPVSSLFFMKNMGKIYDIYDLYQEFYKNEDNLESLSNPSSSTSSQFK